MRRITSVATHQKTQQGLKQVEVAGEDSKMTIVATHQKTQQGLKLVLATHITIGVTVATHQKTQQGLKHKNEN